MSGSILIVSSSPAGDGYGDACSRERYARAATWFRNIERVARRKLLQIHAATELASLRIPPGNQLEALKGDRRGQRSIRINDHWRVCFVWKSDGAHGVEIVDYH